MKKMLQISAFLLTMFILVSYTLLGPVDEVISGLKNGNAAQLSKYFDATIEVGLPSHSDSYSKAQAEQVLQDFFDTKKVRGFSRESQGNTGSATYFIGTLSTQAGQFRTVVHMKSRSEKPVLQDIRIEPKH